MLCICAGALRWSLLIAAAGLQLLGWLASCALRTARPPPALMCLLPTPTLAVSQGLVEGGGLDRPPWLNLAVHVWNSVVAWADLVIGAWRAGTDLGAL